MFEGIMITPKSFWCSTYKFFTCSRLFL